MKFLSNEWFDEVLVRVKEKFSKPGKLSLTFCEVYNNCPGDDKTKWLLFTMEKGIVTDCKYGVGEAPMAGYRGFADYADHVKCCKGELDPKKAVLAGIFKIEDNVGGGNPMRTLALINMYMKLNDAKRVPGLEF